jgi:microcystin-dependent protein
MRDLIDAPALDAFANNEGSAFTVRSADNAELVLNEVDTRLNTREDWERFTLLFRGPAEKQFDGGIHRIDHPRFDAFDMDLRPVQTMNPDPDTMHYQATFTRHVPDREPSRPHANAADEKTSRRGFFGKLAAAAGGAGLLGSLFGSDTARAEEPHGATGLPGSDPCFGEIRAFGFDYAPQDFAICRGQLLAITQNTSLYSLLGTQYGGDGRSTFGLPDLQGRTPIGQGNAPGRANRLMGQSGGQETVTLSANEIPSHDHTLDATLPVSSSEADATTPDGNVLGVQPSSRGTVPVYNTGSGNGSMSVNTQMGSTGGGQSHDNMPPFQVVNYCIALFGIFPSRG